MAKPVASEITSAPTTAMARRNFLTGSSIGLAAEEDRMRVGQVGGVAVAQREKRAQQNHERQRREDRKDSPLEAEALPEDLA